jgi:hypothetical protein
MPGHGYHTEFNILTRKERLKCRLVKSPFLNQWAGLNNFKGSCHECCVTAGHPTY